MLPGALALYAFASSLPRIRSSLPLDGPTHLHSCTFNFTGGPRLSFPFCNTSLSVEDRLTDLIERMTLAEKVSIMNTRPASIPRLGVAALRSTESTHGVSCGCLIANAGGDAATTGCPTSFPNGMLLGATFNRDLWKEIGATIGREARALNNAQKSGVYFFDPNINLMRDPRWGRAQEVSGEDPMLTAEYAATLIKATQTSELDPRYLSAASTAKHFTMYDLEGTKGTDGRGGAYTDNLPRPPSSSVDTLGGVERWNFDASPPLAQFIDYYMPPFKAAVQRAEVAAVMCSYNAAYGVPTCASDRFNNHMMREAWGWDGVIVSDCTALELMQDVKWDNCKAPFPSGGAECTPDSFAGGHNYTGWGHPVGSPEGVGATVRAALVEGGVDYNCGALYRTNLLKAVKQGAVNESDIDRAAARLLSMQFKLGMLDPASEQPLMSLGAESVDNAESRALSRTAATEGFVLLQNEGGTAATLPLKKIGSKFAFIGPHANATQAFLSNYHGVNTLVNSHSPLAAAIARGMSVTYARGCNICDEQPDGFPNAPCRKSGDTSGIAKAVQIAAAADVAILFLGNDQTTEAESFDRLNLTLPGAQQTLFDAVVAAQPNVVVVLVNGGPLATPKIKEKAKAVVEAFYPGQLGGEAILDALLGDTNAWGRLPFTIYYHNFTKRDIRDVDLAHDSGVTYQYFRGPTLWPFGFGLSLTTFSYKWSNNHRSSSPPRVLSTTAIAAGKMMATPTTPHEPYSVRVTNTGKRAGDCVVLAFVVAEGVRAGGDGDESGPTRKLFDFARLQNVAPGESRDIVLAPTAEALAIVDSLGRRVVTSRRLRIEIGDVVSPARVQLELVGDAVIIDTPGAWAENFNSD